MYRSQQLGFDKMMNASPRLYRPTTRERRVKNLEQSLQEIPGFRLKIRAALEPVINSAGVSLLRLEDNLYEVSVHERLLDDDAPDWAESEILNAAIALRLNQIMDTDMYRTQFLFGISSRLKALFCKLTSSPTQSLTSPLDADLHRRWVKTRIHYFPERGDLDNYQLRWSRRPQKTVLASCNPEIRRVTVARAMSRPECFVHIDALLYHEMCHAYLGVPRRTRQRRQIHGKDFRALEEKHPGVVSMNEWIQSGGWHEAARRDRRQKTERSSGNRKSRR